MTRDREMEATADLLAEGYEPDEISLLSLVNREVIRHVNDAVTFELVANNIDRPREDGKYDPRWYTAHSVQTRIVEGLYGVLHGLLACNVESVDGDRCYLGLRHGGNLHADGNGTSWDLTGDLC